MNEQLLPELISLVNSSLAAMTNQAYASGYKYSYKSRWEKGTGIIVNSDESKTKEYYTFSLYIVDKTVNPVGTIIGLYSNHYPTRLVKDEDKLKLIAYKETITNGLNSLVNICFDSYLERLKSAVVQPEEVKAEVKTNEVITDLKDKLANSSAIIK